MKSFKSHKKGIEASKWIIDQIQILKLYRKINILDLASGNGRNCISLAKPNKIVTAIDRDKIKLGKYSKFKNIKTICFDLETKKKWPLKENFFDVILVVNYLFRPKIKKLIKLLKKNGYLFYETFSRGNEKYGTPKNPDFLLHDRELLNVFAKHLTVLSYFNGNVVEKKVSMKQRASFKKKTSY